MATPWPRSRASKVQSREVKGLLSMAPRATPTWDPAKQNSFPVELRRNEDEEDDIDDIYIYIMIDYDR